MVLSSILIEVVSKICVLTTQYLTSCYVNSCKSWGDCLRLKATILGKSWDFQLFDKLKYHAYMTHISHTLLKKLLLDDTPVEKYPLLGTQCTPLYNYNGYNKDFSTALCIFWTVPMLGFKLCSRVN